MLFALITTGAWAQTDVTSTYLTNPSFEYSAEGTTTSAQALTSGGSYYGWTLPALGSSYVNISIGDASTCNGQAFGIPTAKDGDYYYFCRRGWNSSSSTDATMSTTLTTLPVGHYTLTMAYKGLDSWDSSHTSKGSYLKIEAIEEGTSLASQQTATFDAVNGNSAGSGKFSGDSNWKSVTLEFDVATAGDVTLNIVHHFVGGVRTDAVIDDLQLSYTDPEAASHAAALEAAKYTLNGYIKKATALNGVLADATLATAIETAQATYDAADDWSEDYDNTVAASTTLNTAITNALSGTTAVSLTNGNFDTTPNNTLDSEGNTVYGGTLSTATSNPDNTKDFSANTGDHGYLYDVTGWTQYSKFNSTASQGTTSEYGTAMPANGWSTNSTTIPATDMLGASEGAALHLSAGWGDQARYQQTIKSLPSGRYLLYYEVINQHSNTSIASNYIGVNATAGDFYGTTNSFVYSDLKTIEQGVWKAQAFEFNVAKEADINFSVGVTTSTGGSGNGAKLWIDNVLVYRIGDVTVTETDANAIIAEVEALDDVIYNADDKSALTTAKSTFEAYQTLDNYNALNEALVTAQNSVSVYTTLNTAITNAEGWTSDATTVTNPMRTKYTNGEYADDVTANDIYEEYQTAEIAALAAAEATDYTSAILNHSFETGDMTGWSAESRTDTGVKANSNGTYTTTGVDGSYLFNSWGGSAENNVYQTIKGLPAGTYTLSALLAGFNGEELVLAANETTNSVTVAGDKTVGYTVNVVFTLAEAGDVVIKASNTKSQDGSDASFIKADNFKLIAGDVTTDDYTALNNAINEVKNNVAGFDKDEYAPYNNKEAFAALAAAKAVDQEVPMSQTDLDAIVSALTNATWTANTEEVNAVYDGTLANAPIQATSENVVLPGWVTKSGNTRQTFSGTGEDGKACLADAIDGVGLFVHPGTYNYGETTGYTMPLKAGQEYLAEAKYCAWADGSNNNFTLTILKDGATIATKSYGANATACTVEGALKHVKLYFDVEEAGDYVLSVIANGNTFMTDFIIKKAVAEEITLNETEAYTAVTEDTYANVTMNRKVVAGQNAVAVPFDLTADQVKAVFGENAQVYTFEDVPDGENSTINFNTKEANTIEANVPVLVGGATASTQQTINGVILKAGNPVVAGTNFDFVGNYAGTVKVAAGDYFVSGGKLYKSAGDTNLKSFRAFIQNKTNTNGNVKLCIDGVATSIDEIVNGQSSMVNGNIYNLAGQRVSKATKGIFIKNGKKVVVK